MPKPHLKQKIYKFALYYSNVEYIQNQHIINNFERLMPESTFTKKIVEDFDQIDYFVSKENVLNLVDEGYKILPSVYHNPF